MNTPEEEIIRQMNLFRFTIRDKLRVLWWSLCFMLPGDKSTRKLMLFHNQLCLGKHIRAAFSAVCDHKWHQPTGVNHDGK